MHVCKHISQPQEDRPVHRHAVSYVSSSHGCIHTYIHTYTTQLQGTDHVVSPHGWAYIHTQLHTHTQEDRERAQSRGKSRSIFQWMGGGGSKKDIDKDSGKPTKIVQETNISTQTAPRANVVAEGTYAQQGANTSEQELELVEVRLFVCVCVCERR
jgi:hypothetical protein